MKYTLAALLAFAASTVSAQAVTAIINPPSPAPSGCQTSYTGNFEINVANASTTKRDLPLEKRVVVCGGTGTLVLDLANGQLHDAFGRTGYIASNYQFQFDKPPQAGAIYTAGFSVCENGTLALGGSAVFYQCLSGTFYNLYDQSTGGQCSPAYIDIIPCVVEGGVTTTYATTEATGVASTATGAIVTSSAISSPTAATANSTLITSTMSLTTASSVVMVSGVTASSNMTVSTGKVSTTVSPSVTVAPTATGTATSSAAPISSGAAAMFSFGKEVAAMAAGAVAFAMI